MYKLVEHVFTKYRDWGHTLRDFRNLNYVTNICHKPRRVRSQRRARRHARQRTTRTPFKMLFNNRSNLLSAIIFLAGFRTSSAACTTMSSCSGSGTSRFDYGNSFSYNGNTYYCCNSNGDMCTSSSTESECPTPTLSSPPPAPPPPASTGCPYGDCTAPPEQTESADTSQNCKCTCCTGNYCSASIVASYDAESSSDCGAADCRSRFSTLCPASGESGSVSASYSESTISSSSSTTPTASTPTSDARAIKVYTFFLAAVGISLMLAY